MSYSFSAVWDRNEDNYPNVKIEQSAPDGIKLALKEHRSVINGFIDDAVDVIGSTGKVRVTISGHCNPDHEKADGWAGEFMQIRLDELFE